MNRKSIIIIVALFMTSQVIAGCGRCGPSDNKVPKKEKISSAISSTLVMSIPEDGKIEGLVITSCGQCKFGYKEKRGCSLTIKIGESIYPVEGTGIHDHGDEHGSEGFCSAVRVAWAAGKVKKNVFHAKSFTLVGNSN